MSDKYQNIIDNLINFGKSSDKLLAAIIIGSQSRKNKIADEYSDLDLIIIADDPDYFIKTDRWLDNIGKHYVSFVENTFIEGQKERRILFDGALDVDFIVISKKIINIGFSSNEAIAIMKRGYCILIDKINLKKAIPKIVSEGPSFKLDSEEDLINIINDFWFHSVWSVKKIKRGELWTARGCLDSYMKQKLLMMIEYYAHIIHGINYETWYNGRFIEEWAESWVIEKLSLCFSHYDKNDIKTALLSTMDLFRTILLEITHKKSIKYPYEADEYSTKYVKSML